MPVDVLISLWVFLGLCLLGMSLGGVLSDPEAFRKAHDIPAEIPEFGVSSQVTDRLDKIDGYRHSLRVLQKRNLGHSPKAKAYANRIKRAEKHGRKARA